MIFEVFVCTMTATELMGSNGIQQQKNQQEADEEKRERKLVQAARKATADVNYYSSRKYEV